MSKVSCFRKMILLLTALGLGACALKGSPGEARYEGRSNCEKPGFTCGKLRRKTNDGLQPSAAAAEDNQLPSFSGGNNYAPLCRLKNDICQCSCEPVP